MNRRFAAVAVATLLVLTGCSDDDDGETLNAGDGTATTAVEADAPADDGGECRTADDARSADTPELAAPAAEATEMVITDLEVGCGAEIPEGQVVNVEVNYMGKAHSTGEVFDSSFASGESVSFPVGAGRLIEGWDTGLVGMKEGGRRQLLIPGDLAYGAMGSPPDIGPDDTLVFIIDLLAVQE